MSTFGIHYFSFKKILVTEAGEAIKKTKNFIRMVQTDEGYLLSSVNCQSVDNHNFFECEFPQNL
jgi:hypothetical protein